MNAPPPTNKQFRYNELGQPVGFDLPGWQSPPFPPHVSLPGRYCRLEPLDAARHTRDIFDAQAQDRDGSRWTYSFHGPYPDFAAYEQWARGVESSRDPQFYAIVDQPSGRAVGTCAYMRIEPRHGVIEIGNIYFSPQLAQTRAATECMFLLMANAFALGYRRYEWKCDSCNMPSRAAAERYGFTFEGIFRQATVYKGRNRDTAWFSITDKEWPAIKGAYERWLEPGNFDPSGNQKSKLADLIASARKA